MDEAQFQDLVDRKGEVVARFEPTAEMADVEKFAASLL